MARPCGPSASSRSTSGEPAPPSSWGRPSLGGRQPDSRRVRAREGSCDARRSRSVWAIAGANHLRNSRRTDYNLKVGIGPSTAQEARIFGLTRRLVDRFGADWDEGVRPILEGKDRLIGGFGLAYGVLLVACVLVFVVAADAAAAGTIGVGALAVVLARPSISRASPATIPRTGSWRWGRSSCRRCASWRPRPRGRSARSARHARAVTRRVTRSASKASRSGIPATTETSCAG